MAKIYTTIFIDYTLFMGRAKGMTSAGLSGFDQVMGTRRGSKPPVLVASHMTPQADKMLAPYFKKIENGRYNEVLEFLHEHGEDYEISVPLQQLMNELAYYIGYRRHHDLQKAGRFHLSAWGLGASSPIHIARIGDELHILPEGMSITRQAKTVCRRTGNVEPVLAGDWKTAPKEYSEGAQFYDQPNDQYVSTPGRATRCPHCLPYAEMYPECEDHSDHERRWNTNMLVGQMGELAKSQLMESLFTKENGYTETKPYAPRMANLEEGINEELDTEFTLEVASKMKIMGVNAFRSLIGDKHFVYYRKELMKKHRLDQAEADKKMVSLIADQKLPKQLYYDIRKRGIDTSAYGFSSVTLNKLRQQARLSIEGTLGDRALKFPVVLDL